MNNPHFSLSESDVKTVLLSLELLPDYGFIAPDTADASFMLSASAGQKLIMNERLNNREAGIVSLAVDSAYKALRGEITVNPSTVEKLRPYFFSINKLRPVFS